MKKIHFESIDSTNTYLKNNYEDLENYTFVSANTQTQGKGRNCRKWDSENGNLAFSILLKDTRYFGLTNCESILSAYTVLQVLKEYGINDLSIKWPNDVYVGDKKISGILLEAVSKDNIECLIIGVGINVNQTEFDGSYIHEATSMKKVLNKDIDLNVFKEKIYLKFIDNLDKLINGYDFYEDIIKYDYLQNKDAYALINNQKKLVKVKGINKDYTLCVIDDKSEISLNSGEISFHI